MTTRDGVVLLYDGTCGFCAGSVQFILRHEGAHHSLRFAPLQGELGSAVRGRFPALEHVDSLIWYEPPGAPHGERVLVRSEAALSVAEYMGGIWRVLGRLGRVVPRAARDAVYDLIARNRYRIAGKVEACLLPTPEQRVRFLA